MEEDYPCLLAEVLRKWVLQLNGGEKIGKVTESTEEQFNASASSAN